MNSQRRMLLALGVWLPMLATGSQAALAPASMTAVAIDIKDFMFAPGTLTVPVGTEVTWTNRDDDAHTVVSDNGVFRSSALDTGESFHYTFAMPGTYRFSCSLHRRMVGIVVVK